MTRKSKPLPTRLASRLFREALSKTGDVYQIGSSYRIVKLGVSTG